MERPIHTKFDIQACILTLNNTTKGDRHRSTVSSTSHIKLVNWGLEHMESPIHTKFDIQAYILTLNNTTKSYRHRSTGSGTAHIIQIGKLWS